MLIGRFYNLFLFVFLVFGHADGLFAFQQFHCIDNGELRRYARSFQPPPSAMQTETMASSLSRRAVASEKLGRE